MPVAIELARGVSGGLAVLAAFWVAALFITSENSDLALDQRRIAWTHLKIAAPVALLLAVSALYLARRPTGVPVLDAVAGDAR